jgi:hypothetical protein
MIDASEPRRSVLRGEPTDLLTRTDRRQADLEGGGCGRPSARLALVPVMRGQERRRPGDDPADVTDDDVLLRIALWLADVAADAALAATARELR